jgi:hypothetical protein
MIQSVGSFAEALAANTHVLVPRATFSKIITGD